MKGTTKTEKAKKNTSANSMKKDLALMAYLATTANMPTLKCVGNTPNTRADNLVDVILEKSANSYIQ